MYRSRNSMVWICVRRKGHPEEVRPLHLPADEVSLRTRLETWLGVSSRDLVIIKLRDQEGSLLPRSALLYQPTSRTRPLFLEVASPRHLPTGVVPPLSPEYLRTTRNLLYKLNQRVTRVEQQVPDLERRTDAAMSRQTQDLTSVLKFMSKRLDRAMRLQTAATL